MGWSTWNVFACSIDELLIKDVANAMVATGLAKAGYEYVNIDDCWMDGRDAQGHLTYNSTKFPSGMKALAAYIHGLGLKFGMYSSSGPLTCQNYTGSWGHEIDDAATFASWDVDFVKLDCCWQDNVVDRAKAYDSFSQGLLQSGRQILFSCDTDELILKSGNKEYPYMWGPAQCNMARIWYDIYDDWTSTMNILDHASHIGGFSGPGYWNDFDILTVGQGAQTWAEYRTQFSLWALGGSPLIIGADVRNLSQETLAILSHPELIAINQDPLGSVGQRMNTSMDGTTEVWARQLAGNYTHAVVLFNRSLMTQLMTLSLADLFGNFLNPNTTPPVIVASIRDLWARKDLGSFTDTFTAKVEPHGSVVLKVVRTNV